jgi:hypothetical protein
MMAGLRDSSMMVCIIFHSSAGQLITVSDGFCWRQYYDCTAQLCFSMVTLIAIACIITLRASLCCEPALLTSHMVHRKHRMAQHVKQSRTHNTT